MTRFVNASVVLALLLAPVTLPDPANDRQLTDSIVLLERAVSALANPSADYSKILREVVAHWPANGVAVVKTDLATFLARAPDARTDFKCGADFVRYRARKELLRLKDVLLDANPQPARSQFCYAAPFAIDLARAPGAVEIYGYDFDKEPPQLLLMNAFGFRDVTFALIRHNHFHLTLELAKNGLTFSADNQQLAVATGHLIQQTIPVIRPDTSICESRVEEIPAGKAIGFAPPPLDGRQEFSAGSGATLWSNAALDYESNQVDATVCLSIVEPGVNPRVRSGCATELVHSTDADRVIERVVGGLEDQVVYTHRSGSEDVRNGLTRGPVSRWLFGGLGPQQSTPVEPRIAIRLRAARVISTKAGGCVSAIAYLEAKRMHALSEKTVRRLDAQLKKMDLTVLKARPRFSPS
jgi:hypothetical protein